MNLEKQTFLRHKERWSYFIDKNEKSFTTAFNKGVSKNNDKAAYELYPYFSYFKNSDTIFCPDSEKAKLMETKKEGVEFVKNFSFHEKRIRKICKKETEKLKEYLEKSKSFYSLIGGWEKQNMGKDVSFCEYFKGFKPV